MLLCPDHHMSYAGGDTTSLRLPNGAAEVVQGWGKCLDCPPAPPQPLGWHKQLRVSLCLSMTHLVLLYSMAYLLHQSGSPHSHSPATGGYERIGDSPCGAPRPSHSNTSVRAAFVHVVGDLLQSLGVFVAATVIYFKVWGAGTRVKSCFPHATWPSAHLFCPQPVPPSPQNRTRGPLRGATHRPKALSVVLWPVCSTKDLTVQVGLLLGVGSRHRPLLGTLSGVGWHLPSFALRHGLSSSLQPQYKMADPISTFLFSVFVLGSTLTILRDVFRVLMEGELHPRAARQRRDLLKPGRYILIALLQAMPGLDSP